MTPKAPPDIDSWMTDPKSSNTSTFTLANRDVELSTNQGEFPSLAPPTAKEAVLWQSIELNGVNDAFFILGICFILAIFCMRMFGMSLLMYGLYRCSRICVTFVGFQMFSPGASLSHLGWLYRLLGVTCTGVSLGLVFVSAWNIVSRSRSWSATSNFLETCKTQQVRSSENEARIY